MITYVVWNDNGVKGQEGYCEYTEKEIKEMGGIDKLKEKYKENGVHIYNIDVFGEG